MANQYFTNGSEFYRELGNETLLVEGYCPNIRQQTNILNFITNFFGKFRTKIIKINQLISKICNAKFVKMYKLL